MSLFGHFWALFMLFCKQVKLNYLSMTLYATFLFSMVFYICICYQLRLLGLEDVALVDHPYYNVKESPRQIFPYNLNFPKGWAYIDTHLGLEVMALFGHLYYDVKESL